MGRYPRGVPFKPPPAAARPEVADQMVNAGEEVGESAPVLASPPPPDQIRRLMVRLAIATVGTVLLIVAAGVFLTVGALRPSAPRPAAPSETGVLLYQSYLNIGLLADAAENDAYPDAEARKLLGTIVSLMDSADKQLDQAAKVGLAAEDGKKLERTRQASVLLRTQANELRAYWDAPEGPARKAHEMKYHQSREEAWKLIKDLLGLQE